jgi:hypothetical protein
MLESFTKLKNKFENKTFTQTYKFINYLLYYGSYLGHILSIVLSYFFINFVLGDTAAHLGGYTWILPIFIILFLTLFELIKRFTLSNSTSVYLIKKKFNSSVIINGLFAITLVILTFYLSLNGASKFANKSEIIESNIDSLVIVKSDSLNRYYQLENSKLEERINYIYQTAQLRRNKSLTIDETKQVKDWELSIKSNNKELAQKLKDIKIDIANEFSKQKESSDKSKIAFIILSLFIESLIIIGVCFKEYYDFTSYSEQKERLENSENYNNLIVNLELLRLLYNNGKIDKDKNLPSFNQFKDLVFAYSKKYSLKQIKEFITLTNSLKITKLIGKTRVTNTTYQQAQEIIKNHFKL